MHEYIALAHERTLLKLNFPVTVTFEPCNHSN